MANTLAREYSVTVLHLPGAERSFCRPQDNNPRGLASLFAVFLQERDICRPHVVGLSYGGSVAVELAGKMDLRSLTLISSGEYFNFPTKLLFSALFYPTLHFPRYAKVFADLYTRTGFVDCSQLNEDQIGLVCQRWYNVLWYSLPQQENKTPTLLMPALGDKVVGKSSLRKIVRRFPRNKVISFDVNHCQQIDEMEKTGYQEILSFLKEC